MDDNEETAAPGPAFPIVNLNGSTKERLVDGYKKALASVRSALQDVIESAPHGRDYQLQPPEDYVRACKEHVARIAGLHRIADELQEILNQVRKQRGRSFVEKDKDD